MPINYLEIKLPKEEVRGLKELCGKDCFENLNTVTEAGINELIQLRELTKSITDNMIFALIERDIKLREVNDAR